MQRIPFESSSSWRPAGLEAVYCGRARYREHRFCKHIHDGFGIAVVVDGVHAFRCRGAAHFATAASLVTINPGEAHDGWAPEACGYELRSLLLPSDVLAALTAEAATALEFDQPVHQAPALARRFAMVHTQLELHRDEAACSMLCDELLLDLVNQVVTTCGTRARSQSRASHERRMWRAAEWMRENLGRPIKLIDVAASAGLSPSYFLRSFKRCLGVTPHAYLSWARLERGRELLLEGVPIVTVASEVGFSDQSHFTRCFRRAFGCTPNAMTRASSLGSRRVVA